MNSVKIYVIVLSKGSEESFLGAVLDGKLRI